MSGDADPMALLTGEEREAARTMQAYINGGSMTPAQREAYGVILAALTRERRRAAALEAALREDHARGTLGATYLGYTDNRHERDRLHCPHHLCRALAASAERGATDAHTAACASGRNAACSPYANPCDCKEPTDGR